MQKTCETCGNTYARAFSVVMGGQEYVFDSFECAIHKLAPHCSHCEMTIIGHGVDSDGRIYCCNHCLTAHSQSFQSPNIGASGMF